MTYNQVEDIIYKELLNENFKIVKYHDFGEYHTEIKIPKTKTSSKITIELYGAFWDEENLRYTTWANHSGHAFEIKSCYLISGFTQQGITIHNKKLKYYIKDMLDAFWDSETRVKLDERWKNDNWWAAKFKKVFK